jgi:hypothetical protein
MFWAILLLSSVKTRELLRIRLVCSPGEMFQAIIRGKWSYIASVVSYSVLFLGCGQIPNSHVLGLTVTFTSKSVISFAASTRMYVRGNVSSYHWGIMCGYCFRNVLFSVVARVCSAAQTDTLWGISFFSQIRTWELLQILLACIPGDVSQAVIREKWVDIASLGSYSVLVVVCDQTPNSRVLSTTASFVEENLVSLENLTCT